MTGVSTGYDITTYAWFDVVTATRLESALRAAGLRGVRNSMFIAGFDGITAGIAGALTAWKIFIAYYSSWSTRPACQCQQTTAFLAVQRETDPLYRILRISPERGVSHLMPVGLADVRFSTMPMTPQQGNRLTQPEARRAATAVAATRQDRGHGRPLPLHGSARHPGRREIPCPRCRRMPSRYPRPKSSTG